MRFLLHGMKHMECSILFKVTKKSYVFFYKSAFWELTSVATYQP